MGDWPKPANCCVPCSRVKTSRSDFEPTGVAPLIEGNAQGSEEPQDSSPSWPNISSGAKMPGPSKHKLDLGLPKEERDAVQCRGNAADTRYFASQRGKQEDSGKLFMGTWGFHLCLPMTAILRLRYQRGLLRTESEFLVQGLSFFPSIVWSPPWQPGVCLGFQGCDAEIAFGVWR